MRHTFRFHLASLAQFIVFAIGLSAAIACDANRESTASGPNILLIIGDDHGWPYFGFMGHPIVRTPHLDALAAESTFFRNGFATASSCRASLMSLLTGLHPIQWDARERALQRRGVSSVRGDRIRDLPTLPRLLAKRGYASFQGGKYWEGSYRDGGFSDGTKTAVDFHPDDTWRDWSLAQSGGEGLELGRSTMQPLWDFLDAHRAGPFFVWFAPKLPHTPHDPEERHRALYANAKLSDRAQKYYANITRFDERVGEVVAYLERTGLRQRTLVVYVSDNGWQQGSDTTPSVASLGGPNGKWSLHELGFRTPVLFSWPGRISGGRVLDALVSTVDIFATLVDFARLEPPANATGLSLRRLLMGEADFDRTRVIGSATRVRPPPTSEGVRGADLTRPERVYFLRNESWRYLWYRDSEGYPDRNAEELYRIDEDPMETRDVAAEHPERTLEYRNEIRSWVENMQRPFAKRQTDGIDVTEKKPMSGRRPGQKPQASHVSPRPGDPLHGEANSSEAASPEVALPGRVDGAP